MAVLATGTIRIKRRASGGAAGAPSSLKTSEIAYNEADDTLYIGFGDDGNGNATSIRAFAGAGTFATQAFVNAAVAGLDEIAIADVTGLQDALDGKSATGHGHNDATTGASGFMSAADKSKLNGIAAGANNYTHPTSDGNRHVPTTGADDINKFLKSAGTAGNAPDWASVGKSDVGLGNVDNTSDLDKPVSTAQQAALDAKAPLASPALTGTPTAPTATAGTNTTQIANTAFVTAAVEAILGMAPSDLDTLAEIAARIQSGESDQDAIVTSLAGKLTASSNLSDLANAATARTNLGLASMATQAADNVSITGGSITGVEVDGGAF